MTSTLLERWRRLLGAVAVMFVASGSGLAAGPAAGATVLAAATPTWSMVSPPVSPPPLAYASMASDSDNGTLVLFGGELADGTLSSDTWVWNGSTWTQFFSPVPARRSAAMAFDPALHQLILFGGQRADGSLLSDTWAWNGASWVPQQPATSPPAREGATLAFDANDQLMLFGGTAAAPPSGTTGMIAPVPPPTHMTMGDTWVWTGTTWSQQSVAAPPPRTDSAAAWDGTQHQTLVFGGSSAPSGTKPPTALLGDTWVWGAGAWEATSPSVSPPPRNDATVVADSDLGGIVAFGGNTATGPVADTWLWNGQTWAHLAPTSSPLARLGAAGAYDAAAHQLVVFGGINADGGLLADTEILTAMAPATPGATPSALPITSVPDGRGVSTTQGKEATPVTRSNPTPALRAGARPSASATATTTATTSPRSDSPASSPLRQVRGGELVTLRGTGFRPDTPITITFHSTPYLVGQSAANPDGVFSATVAVPTGASPGTHHFEAVGIGGGGGLIALMTPVDVAALVHHRSWVQAVVLAAVAIVLPLGAWLIMMATSHRRSKLGVT